MEQLVCLLAIEGNRIRALEVVNELLIYVIINRAAVDVDLGFYGEEAHNAVEDLAVPLLA